jgi:hypothetical protein
LNAAEWFAKAQQTIAGYPPEKRKNLPIVTDQPSEQKNAWYGYFIAMGFMPATFRLLVDGQAKAFTLPTEWPWELDLAYGAPLRISPIPDRKQLRQSRENLEDLQRRHGPNWGLKLIEEAKRRASSHQPPTDDQLREIYSTRKPSADAAE